MEGAPSTGDVPGLRRELGEAVSTIEGVERRLMGVAVEAGDGGGPAAAAGEEGSASSSVDGIYGEINALVGTLKRCRALGQGMDEAGDRIPSGVLECLDAGENPDLHLRRDIEDTQAAYNKTMGQSGALKALERALRAEASAAFPEAYARYQAQTAYRKAYGGNPGRS